MGARWKGSTLYTLPADILASICHFLQVAEVCRAKCVSRDFEGAARASLAFERVLLVADDDDIILQVLTLCPRVTRLVHKRSVCPDSHGERATQVARSFAMHRNSVTPRDLVDYETRDGLSLGTPKCKRLRSSVWQRAPHAVYPCLREVGVVLKADVPTAFELWPEFPSARRVEITSALGVATPFAMLRRFPRATHLKINAERDDDGNGFDARALLIPHLPETLLSLDVDGAECGLESLEMLHARCPNLQRVLLDCIEDGDLQTLQAFPNLTESRGVLNLLWGLDDEIDEKEIFEEFPRMDRVRLFEVHSRALSRLEVTKHTLDRLPRLHTLHIGDPDSLGLQTSQWSGNFPSLILACPVFHQIRVIWFQHFAIPRESAAVRAFGLFKSLVCLNLRNSPICATENIYLPGIPDDTIRAFVDVLASETPLRILMCTSHYGATTPFFMQCIRRMRLDYLQIEFGVFEFRHRNPEISIEGFDKCVAELTNGSTRVSSWSLSRLGKIERRDSSSESRRGAFSQQGREVFHDVCGRSYYAELVYDEDYYSDGMYL